MKFAAFNIGGEEFGIEIGRVVEFLGSCKVYALPGLPDFLSGVIVVRREVIPLLDLRKRFNMVPSPGIEDLMIVVRYDDEKIALLVDGISEILSIADIDITAPPTIFKGLRRKYLTGIGRKNDRIIILLNVDEILSSEEKIILKETEAEIHEDAGSQPVAE